MIMMMYMIMTALMMIMVLMITSIRRQDNETFPERQNS